MQGAKKLLRNTAGWQIGRQQFVAEVQALVLGVGMVVKNLKERESWIQESEMEGVGLGVQRSKNRNKQSRLTLTADINVCHPMLCEYT